VPLKAYQAHEVIAGYHAALNCGAIIRWHGKKGSNASGQKSKYQCSPEKVELIFVSLDPFVKRAQRTNGKCILSRF